ncbi:hypothetical protein [Bradyrhizobium sp. S3.9.1]|uniref:hypothetical protein n=1 Tax=Bradyrhizobium sp. S3.9.1 TaxID=3156431 RepID=UPI0033975235
MTDLLDVASIPPQVRDRMYTLRGVAQDRRAALLRLSEERNDARIAQMEAESRVAQLRSQRLPDDHEALAPLIDEIRRREATIARLGARTDELTPSWENSAKLVERLENYLRQHAAAGIALHDGVAPKLQKGEGALDGLDRAGRRTRTLLADRRDVLSAPFPVAIVKKHAREQLAARIEAAKPDVSDLVEQLEPIKFPMSPASIEQIYASAAGPLNAAAVDVVGLMAWLHPKEFLAALDREIDAVGDDEAALSAEQRIAKLAQIDGDLLASAREESHFAEMAGVLPRPDLDPRAVLQLSDRMAPPSRHGG